MFFNSNQVIFQILRHDLQDKIRKFNIVPSKMKQRTKNTTHSIAPNARYQTKENRIERQQADEGRGGGGTG